MRVSWIAIVLLVIGATAAQAAPSYLGPSGNIMTPDELTTPARGFSFGYHRFVDIGFRGTETDLDVYEGNYGLTSNIEVGLSVVDRRNGNDSDVAINGKWRILDETATRPALAVGVLDAAGEAVDDDPSFYILVTKDLTRTAAEVVEAPSKPLRGTLGAGSGFFDGVFAGLDWTLTPRLSVMAEYVRGGDLLAENTLINGGIRYAVGSGLRLDAAAVDFDKFAFGISYTSIF